MEKELGATVELVRSTGGVFEVTADAELVHSKKSTGAFPEEGALVRTLRQRRG